MSDKPVITRFAPSPTGYLHMGGARTALFNHLFTKQRGGTSILRIEDTDKIRSTKEYEESIINSLAWLGISFDQTFKQSDREEVYRKHLAALIERGAAYVSKETPVEPGGRTEVIRFKNPNKKVVFTDLIRGEIGFDTTELGDFVIAKSLEEPLYHLAVVADDFEMGITHVVRGEDHISNTPRQILIQEALGAPRPVYAHLPIILAPDKSKLSKRKHGEAVSVDFYRQKGYMPEAIINFLALLGWNPGTDQETFNLDQLIKDFDISKVQKGGAVFNTEKLDSIDRGYIRLLSDESFMERSKTFVPEWMMTSSPSFKRLIPLLREKIAAFGDIQNLLGREGELGFIQAPADYPADLLLWKKSPDPVKAREHLIKAKEIIGGISADHFDAASIKDALWPYAEANGRGDVLWPLRVALTGREKSPDPFVAAQVIGSQETLRRVDTALGMLS